MKKILSLFQLLAVIFTFSSCVNHSIDDLTEPIPPVDFVTYNEHVKTIIDNNCIFCHSSPPVNGAPNSLITYDQVKNSVLNTNLIGRISAQTGETGAMPFGGPRLPQNLIDIITQWETDGLLEQ